MRLSHIFFVVSHSCCMTAFSHCWRIPVSVDLFFPLSVRTPIGCSSNPLKHTATQWRLVPPTPDAEYFKFLTLTPFRSLSMFGDSCLSVQYDTPLCSTIHVYDIPFWVTIVDLSFASALYLLARIQKLQQAMTCS